MKEKEIEPVNILWTGGWDSTFRMIQLAVSGNIIQPYYIIDTNRKSSLKEMKQISIIKNLLSNKYKECNIKDVINIELNSIDIDSIFNLAYERLNEDSFIGSQYVWIAALSKKIKNLELSIHQDDKAEYFVRKLINRNRSKDSDEYILFGDLKFPLLNYTKLSMEDESKITNDTEILYHSWFCFEPLNDTPCGVCNPCVYTIQEGMSKRFNFRGKLYNKAPRFFKLLRRVINKIA